MNQSVTYLMDEICAGVEIYYTGRIGGQYIRTSFILCDDYSELVSKLFLLRDEPGWSEKRGNGSFKNYHDIMRDVESVVTRKMPEHQRRVNELQEAMKNRRNRRNDFFHSTNLLDLSVTQRNCVDSFCELLEYGAILMGVEWRGALENCRNLETLEILLRLERVAFSDPSITPKVNQILQSWPRNNPNNEKKGAHVAVYPEDLHLRLCVTCGGKSLRDKLKVLLSPKKSTA